ncbi:uncharacterized protein LOC111716254 [Eurytemora carolleeae]|uniref:uncharacterized protein LOC111716254 n=1 Tax=Eurytemora carolleeae TaxID=1294199 RepID=UPI000C7803BF|nr:uncharacterized protein LOC111716254 [Eurytemora carolleeae]|eukprot:XP_023347459.1 uncharacterized protein LOC111716254 [Eurytemora affinis]
MLNQGEPEKILEISEFSMLRLNDIAEQRKLYSSFDDIMYPDTDHSDCEEKENNDQNMRILRRRESPPTDSFPTDSDDLIARDIEEFERQKHHLKSNLKESAFSFTQFLENYNSSSAMSSSSSTWPSSELAVVGHGMVRHRTGVEDGPPSKPLSRLSSLGSLLEFSSYSSNATCNQGFIVNPLHPTPNQDLSIYRGSREVRLVGGGGIVAADSKKGLSAPYSHCLSRPSSSGFSDSSFQNIQPRAHEVGKMNDESKPGPVSYLVLELNNHQEAVNKYLSGRKSDQLMQRQKSGRRIGKIKL